MNRYIFILFLVSIIFGTYAISISKAYAAGTTVCQPIYGGGETCVKSDVIQVDKKIFNDLTKSFVDNLINFNDPKEPRFGPNEDVVFQIVITNTSNSTIERVSVQDVLPQFVDYVAGSGNFDPKTRTLSFDLHDLKPNEERTVKITGRVTSVDKLPAKGGITCIANQAIASSTNQGTSQDNAQFCIDAAKKALEVTESKGGLKVFPSSQALKTPSTGPEALSLLALASSGIIGFILKRRAVR